MKNLWIICRLTVLFVSSISGSHFRGGTMSWKYVGQEDEVEFKYKLAWKLRNEASASWVAQNTSSTATLSSMRYNQTAINTAEDWEEGEMTFRHNFTSKGPYNVSYGSSAWIPLSNGGGGSWKLQTTVDLHQRNDTSRRNQSPQTSSRAIYRVQFGCDVTIQIPVIDGDGDNVRCRWATSDEASSVAGLLPDAVLDEERCQIRFIANAVNNYVADGWYAAAITIEDFPKETILMNGEILTPRTPISKIPLQFLISPETMTGPCSDKPVFVTSTLPEGTVVVVKPGHTFSTNYYVHSVNELSRVDITGNTAIIQSFIQTDDQNRPDVYKVDITWTPTEVDKGTYIICATAKDINWKLSDTRCISVVAWDDLGPCVRNPCQNLGNCEIVSDDYKCHCIPGFIGQDCEIDINECESNPCLNNGSCTDFVDSWYCTCPTLYTGTQCQTAIDPCESNPCYNFGTCEDISEEYKCHCLSGYTGTNCEIDINECESNPCFNNGSCIDSLGSYYCACQCGYTGILCKTDVEECSSNPCMNNGTCSDLVNGFNCNCQFDSTGDICENRIDNCVSSPCLHGGVCENQIGGFKCRCLNSWQGDVCEYKLINKTEECTELEYTECTCRTSLQKRLVKKSYMTGFGSIGMVTGFLATVAVYIAWTLPNCQKSNKVHSDNDAFMDCKIDDGNDEEAQYEESEQSRENRIDNHPICQCFVDHTGYDHLQRRQKDDKHQYKIHQCSTKSPNLKISSVRFKV